MKELEDIFFEDLHTTNVICVYGQSHTDFYEFLVEWIDEKEDRSIVFLEDDKKKYSSLQKKISKIFPSKNVKIQLLDKNLDESLKTLAWSLIYLDLKILKSNIEKREKNFQKISEILNSFHIGATITSYLYSDLGIRNFENVYNNILQVDKFALFDGFKDKFKNIPAIISGAGPSLDKNIHLLKEVYDKALIFSGGSALNIFSKKNIKFHFSAFVDQLPFYERFKNNHFFENVFFYQNQMNYHNFSLVHANKVLLSDASLFPIENWLYQQLDIKQNSIEAGWNVTSFLVKIASHMGCNPICFVGLDLCYKKNKYAKGVVKTKGKYHLVKVKDIYDNPTYTQKDWILAKNWIEEFALNNQNINFINATEGGLKIENVKNAKLSDVAGNFTNFSDLDGYVHSIFQAQEKISLEKTKIIKVLKTICESFERSDGLCDEYLLEIQKGNLDLNIIKFQKEVVYVHLLDPIWQIWKHVLLREIEKDSGRILINKLIFFKTIISKHLELLRNIL